MDDKFEKRLLEAGMRLATRRANDVVKLALLEPGEALAAVDKLDLTLLDTFSRKGDGTVQVKVLDRISAMTAVWDRLRDCGDPDSEEHFFRMLEDKQ